MTAGSGTRAPDGSGQLWADFNRICEFGGRLAGSESELAARSELAVMGERATGVPCQVHDVPYRGWVARRCELHLPDGPAGVAHPLVRSAATGPHGLEAEVVDLGRGTPDQFAARASDIPGRIVLVRHELMFAAGTVHRGRKFQAALEYGAAGFLIAGPEAGQAVAGSTGGPGTAAIPAAGIAPETAGRLTGRDGKPMRVRLVVDAEDFPATSQNLIFDIAGGPEGWVVLSAHIDGHDIGESAIDNASGLAVALAVARGLAPAVSSMRRGLRLVLFNVEEWTLTGSDHYVAGLDVAEKNAMAINVNLDSVAGGGQLTALTSEFAGMEPFLIEQANRAGVRLDLFRPLQMNSDHGNFARAGIPAFRLVAGFDDPGAATRLVLTPQDTRDKVSKSELEKAARLAKAIVAAALDATPAAAAAWRR